MESSRQHPKTLFLPQDFLPIRADRTSLGSCVAGTGVTDEDFDISNERIKVRECSSKFNRFSANSFSTFQTLVDFQSEDLPRPNINMIDDGGKLHSLGDQYIGNMISQGKHFHIPIRRRCSYDCIQKSLVVTDKEGGIKTEYPVGEIQVFRKVKDIASPTLEMVVGGQTRRIEFESEKDLQGWYTRLQQEKVKVICADEEKNHLSPGYHRPAKRNSSSVKLEKETGNLHRLFEKINLF